MRAARQILKIMILFLISFPLASILVNSEIICTGSATLQNGTVIISLKIVNKLDYPVSNDNHYSIYILNSEWCFAGQSVLGGSRAYPPPTWGLVNSVVYYSSEEAKIHGKYYDNFPFNIDYQVTGRLEYLPQVYEIVSGDSLEIVIVKDVSKLNLIDSVDYNIDMFLPYSNSFTLLINEMPDILQFIEEGKSLSVDLNKRPFHYNKIDYSYFTKKKINKCQALALQLCFYDNYIFLSCKLERKSND